ncbi:hypothetical protein K2173_018867 [Erythroxylum novogranatense]|uniref:Trichome birefringence-like N-terminal domain-containing protein n=1 Tax=Erythroxylum novogranatense TaxID=1862640 RepID=A0AAV8SAY8_9ROSI|nr:hypothetical protein K2173_018867 [Erythroxylum novogranatense]
MSDMRVLAVLLVLAALLISLQLQRVEGAGACDVYEGSWVKDDHHHPAYKTDSCPFIEKQFDCLHNGRSDQDFLKYRWQPLGCNLPSFDGEDFLSRLRGKKIMFVGDSLSLNQWQSLTCLLHVAVPHTKYTSTRAGGLSTFSFPAYNVEIMFYRNAFLVDIVSTSSGAVLKLNSIEGGELWKRMDVLVFNTWHWWLHTGRKQPWNYIEDGNNTYKDMDRLVAYEKGLRTWAQWVGRNIDPVKTKVFFQGVSPDHNNGTEWGDPNAKNCGGQTQALKGGNNYVYPGGPHPAEVVLEKVVGGIGMSKALVQVHLLNITSLSQLRKDAHPSVYGHGGHNDMDCTHWCLPGLPDTWNQLLYAALSQLL